MIKYNGKATLGTRTRCKIEMMNNVVDEERLRISRKSITSLEESDKSLLTSAWALPKFSALC